VGTARAIEKEKGKKYCLPAPEKREEIYSARAYSTVAHRTCL